VKIKSVRIKNFRSIDDQLIKFDSYGCLVGPNGSGKSTVLNALNVFFGESSSATPVDALSAEDFHLKRTDQPVEITLTFHDLSTRAQEELQDYYRNGELIVSATATFDEEKGKAVVQQWGSRMAFPAFARFFEAMKAKSGASALQEIFDELRQAFPTIPAPAGRSIDHKKQALLAFESDPNNAHLLEPLRSADHFYGIAGAAKLRPFVQWVYVPAVKDASDEQSETRDGALGKLLARTVHARVNLRADLTTIEQQAQQRYQELMDANQGVLDEVATALSRRLGEWSHPDVDLRINWSSLPISVKTPSAQVRVGEQGFEGELARFGHGFQRSYLLALLQELATTPGDDAPTLILGIEEPELYQHPPQSRYLSQVLQRLASQNCQVLITTHSPYFIGGQSFECVRLFRKHPQDRCTHVLSLTHQRFAERYAEADEAHPMPPSAIEAQLNEVLRSALNEMFFAGKVIFVEGSEDAAYLMTWMTLTDRLGNFRRQGAHVVPVEGKSNMAKPLIIAQELGIPVYVIFDGDRAQSGDGRQIAANRRLLRVLGGNHTELFPDQVRWETNYVQWPEDLASIVDDEIRTSLGHDGFDKLMDVARQRCGFAPSLNKNTMFIQHKLAAAREGGCAFHTLERLCAAILT
jgi:putative ATP-dependent endonuclease of OLD family